MILQNPLALIGFVLIPLVIILRLWQTRPIKIFVSSIFIWRRLSETSLKAQNRSVRKIVLVTLLLILAISTLVLGLAQPALKTTTTTSQPVIIILDNSVSMDSLVGDQDTTRWQRVIKELKTLLNNLPGFAPVSLIVGARGANTVYTEQTPRGISNLIETLTPIGVPSDMENLITQAVGLINPVRSKPSTNSDPPSPALGGIRRIGKHRDWTSNGVNRYAKRPDKDILTPQVYICSDRMPDEELLQLLPLEPLFILVGEPSRNSAIIHAAVTRGERANSIDILVRVNNFSETTLSDMLLEVYAYKPDDQGAITEPNLITKTRVNLAAREEKTLVLEDIAWGDQSWEVTAAILEIRLDIADDLVCDNRVWLSLNPTRKFRIALVGKPAPNVLRALQVQPQLEVEYLPIEGPNFTVSTTAFYDLYIFNHCLPIPGLLPPEIKLVLVNPPADFYPFSIKGIIDKPTLNFIDLNAPLLAYVNLDEVHCWQGLKIEVAPEARDSFHTFVSADRNPLIGEWHNANQHFILIGFDPDWRGARSQTDWALSISFPIFWTNLVNYLLEDSPATPRERDYIFYHSGELIRPNLRILFTADQLSQIKEITLTGPDGSSRLFEPQSFAFIPDRVGIYGIKVADQIRFLTVNLCNASASDNNGTTQKYQIANSEDQNATTTIIQLKPLTFWLVLSGLVLLLLTWYLERHP